MCNDWLGRCSYKDNLWILRSSQAVRPTTVNRVSVGSNPTSSATLRHYGLQ